MKDLCDTCAKFPRECPWARESKEDERLNHLLIHAVVKCTDHEEERR